MATTIYTLSYNGQVRYVGQTVRSLKARLRRHMWEAQSGATRYVSNWIRSLDLQPDIVPLVVVENDLGAATEREIIALYRRNGHRLTNLTDGGDGMLGHRVLPGTRRKISATLKGRPKSLTHRANMMGNKNSLGCTPSTATREKISLSLKSRKIGQGESNGNARFRDIEVLNLKAIYLAIRPECASNIAALRRLALAYSRPTSTLKSIISGDSWAIMEGTKG